MKRHRQSGVTLVETAIVAGIVAIGAGGALFAIAGVGKYAGRQGGATRTAALVLAEQTLRVAQNTWKYGSPGLGPSGTRTVTLPGAAVSSTQGALTTAISAQGNSANITVTVRYTPEPGRDDPGVLSIDGSLVQKAPLPGSQIQKPGLIPLPSGAP